MGNTTDMLVVVATMYDNPQGLTKEEILKKFNKIRLKNSLGIGDLLDSGLYGFSRLFNLKYTKQYLKNRKKYWNEKYKYFSKRELIVFNSFYKVIEKSHKSVGKIEIKCNSIDSSDFGGNLFEGNKVGEYVWKGDFTEIKVPEKFRNPKYSFLVKKILNQEVEREDFDLVKVNEILGVEVIQFNLQEFKFNSLEELWSSYPEYYPENKYDFNQKNGLLYPSKLYGLCSEGPSFRWIKKGDKYFLDFEHFSRILNANSYFGESGWKHQGQKNKSRYSLTDVVLTSEAIRRKNWKKLDYNAFFEDNRNFIYGNEKTFRKYEQAVLETELITEARNKGWTNFEFMREYHLKIFNRNQVPYEEIKRMLKEENKQRGIKKRKNTIRWKKEEEKRKKNEQDTPF